MSTTKYTERIVAHLFSYRGDADLVMENLLCTKQAIPEAKLVVIDDANAPCNEEIRRRAEEIGVEWRVSTWPRGGNLRGKACILGILSEMMASSQGEDDVLLKIDADTCLLNASSLREFARGNQIMWGSGYPDERIYGCAYALKSHAVRKVIEYIEPLELENDAPEDIIIGFSVVNLFPNPEDLNIEIPLGVNNSEGKWTAYHWGRYPVVSRYRGFYVVTVGNKPKPPITKKQRRPVMRNLRLQAAADLKNKPVRKS